MLQFLYPIGLLAAIGIIVPVVIHLWNIKSGKTLKIGSIALLGTASNQRSSHLKIADWPLLLLRCLLLLLLALVLAGPLYRASTKSAEQPGWILLEKQNLGILWKKNRTEIDSLIKKGYEIRDLHPGFGKLQLKDTGTVFSRPAATPLSYFSFIRQLNAEKQPGAKVYLYTDKQLSRFDGTQPSTTLDLKWRFFEADTSGMDKRISEPDTSKLLVLINANGLQTDAAYLRAAVNAIADFTKRDITIKAIRSLGQVTKEATLVFWLSEKTLSSAELKQLPDGVSFFNYAGLKTEQLQSVIQYQPGTSTKDIALYRRKQFNGQAYQSVWTDGFGTPLLTLDSSAIKHYQFYSRFNQSWTDLVWSNGLVEALLPLVIPHLEPEPGFNNNADKTRAIYTVPLPARGTVKTKTAAILYQSQPLSSFVWWLIIIVFFIERWITYRKTERKI